MNKKSPCFPFYPSDFFGDVKVRVMSPDAQAFYLLLLANIWDFDTQYSIPDDAELLCNLLRIERSRFEILISEIRPCFLVHKGRLVSKRLKEEKEKQDNYRKQQSEKGKRSAEQRFNRGSTVVQPDTQPKGNSSNPTPNPKPKEEKKGATPFVLPDWILKEAWDGFVEMRRKKGPFTDRAKRLICEKLDTLRKYGHDPTAVLNQSVERSWTGVFELKQQAGGNGHGTYQRLDKFGKPAPRQKWEDEADRINAEYYRRKAADNASDGKSGTDA